MRTKNDRPIAAAGNNPCERIIRADNSPESAHKPELSLRPMCFLMRGGDSEYFNYLTLIIMAIYVQSVCNL